MRAGLVQLRAQLRALRGLPLIALLIMSSLGCGEEESSGQEPPAEQPAPPMMMTVDPAELGVPLCSVALPGEMMEETREGVERVALTITHEGAELEGVAFLPESAQGAPIALMLSGGSINGARYDWLGEALAVGGYATVISQQNGGGERLGLPVAMLASLERAALSDRVDLSRVFVIGHSFGGLNALCLVAPSGCPETVGALSPEDIPEGLLGVVTLMSHAQPFEEPDKSTPIQLTGTPIMMVQGTRDGRSTVEEVTATFNRLEGETAHLLVTLEGVNHFQVAECLDATRDNYREELPAEVSHEVALERIAAVTLGYLDSLNGGAAFVAQFNDEEGIIIESR